MTLDEALNHPIFEGITGSENSLAGQPVGLDFEDQTLDKKRLRALMLAEIRTYQKK